MSAEPAFDRKSLDQILTLHKGKSGALIPVLQETQETYGFLPRTAVEIIARSLSLSVAQVYGVATFYSQFHLKPRGKHIIRVCLGTACHVRGGERIVDQLAAALGVAPGGTTSDLLFTLEKVACLGACGLAPTMMVDQDTYGRLTARGALDVIDRYRNKAAEVDKEEG